MGKRGVKDASGEEHNSTADAPKATKRVKNSSVPQLKPTGEKVCWSKLKQEKKELKVKRKKLKDTFEVSKEAKAIYEKLKCKKTDVKAKQKLSKELYTLLKKNDSLKKVVMAHDTARVIQCLYKNSSPEIKKNIAKDLMPISVQMATSRYAHFCVMRILKYADSITKKKFIASFYGNIFKLSSHAISSKIIDLIFLQWAHPEEKSYMKQELYGGIYRKSKDPAVHSLSDTYKHAEELKMPTLQAVKSNLEHFANKKLVDNSLVHAVLLEYLQECSEEQRNEIISLYSSLVPSLVTTKEGCRAAILCFWYSGNKERRLITKSLKEHMIKVITHEHGHVLVLAIVNALDDTKAIKKVIFDSILPDIQNVVNSQWGRKVMEWFVSPAGTECIHPSLVNFLDEGLKYSKKDKDVRRKEIFEQIEESLCTEISDNTSFWLKDGHVGLVTANIIKKVSPDNLSKVAESIAKLICEEEWKVVATETKSKKKSTKESDDQPTIVLGIEDPGLHIALKKMIKHDKERVETNSPTLSASIVKHLTSEKVLEWIKLNRACFILLTIVENCDETTKSDLREILETNVDTLKQQNHVGAKLLTEKLSL